MITPISDKMYNREKFKTVKPTMLNKEVGYRINEVELFLEEISIDIENMERENAKLKEQVQLLSDDRTAVAAERFEQPTEEECETLKEELKKKLKHVETLERAYKRMIVLAEHESETLKEEGKQSAIKMLKEAEEKADALIKEGNIRYTDKEREIIALNSKAQEVKDRLRHLVQFINEDVI